MQLITDTTCPVCSHSCELDLDERAGVRITDCILCGFFEREELDRRTKRSGEWRSIHRVPGGFGVLVTRRKDNATTVCASFTSVEERADFLARLNRDPTPYTYVMVTEMDDAGHWQPKILFEEEEG